MMGLYKPGQGYWVRVLTAVGVGILVLFGALWGWGQAQAVRLPAKEWTMSTSAGRGDVNIGDTIALLRDSRDGEGFDQLGTGLVTAYRPSASGRADVVIAYFDTNETRDLAADTRRLIVGMDPTNPTFRATVDGTVAEPIFPQLYLQAGVAGGIILIGAILIGWFVASSPKSSDFLIATDSEMKKVHWSTYKQIKGSTIVVIVATFLIAGFLFVIDIGFSTFFKWIDVLQG